MIKKSGGRTSVGKRGTVRESTPRITSEEALAFIRNMQKAFPKAPRSKKEKARLQQYLAQFRDQVLKAVSERIQSDLLLREPRTVTRDEFETPQPSRRGRAARRDGTRKQ
jgi:hypothetical protein